MQSKSYKTKKVISGQNENPKLRPTMVTTTPITNEYVSSPTLKQSGFLFRDIIECELSERLDHYAPISLKDMDSTTLLDRTDTKYLLSMKQLVSVLSALRYRYRVLEIKGQRLNQYRTLYFDTPDFDLYHRHVTGNANCYKVRSREYVDTHLSFLEVKHKTNKKRTVKSRLLTQYPVTSLNSDSDEFLNGNNPYDSAEMEPKLWNTFTRITLVSKIHFERLTLDIDLKFFTGSAQAHLDDVAIAEVKQDVFSKNSDFIAQMRMLGIRSTGFSKYCIGTSLLYNNVKKNNLKPKFLLLEKISKGMLGNERTV